MRLIICFILLVLSALTSMSLAAEKLRSDQIEKLVSGKRFKFSGEEGNGHVHGWQSFKSNGSSKYGGGGIEGESGTWWVSNNKLCMKFPEYNRGKRACKRVKKLGARKFQWGVWTYQ